MAPMKTPVVARMMVPVGAAELILRNGGTTIITPTIQLGDGPVPAGYLELVSLRPGQLGVYLDDGVPAKTQKAQEGREVRA